MDYEYNYNNARSRYYNACSEISSCQGRLSELNEQKQNRISTINQLKADIKKTQAALDDVEQTINSEETLREKNSVVADKTNQAAVNFIDMVRSDNVTSKSLTDVYSDEASKTTTALNDIFSMIKNKKTELINKIADLQNQLSRAEADLQDINNQIRSTESDLQSWSNTQRSASYDMEYYRRKMQEAV